MISHYNIEKKYFEIKYRELLKKMYNNFYMTYQTYPLEFHKKRPINYEMFVNYCFSISLNKVN